MIGLLPLSALGLGGHRDGPGHPHPAARFIIQEGV